MTHFPRNAYIISINRLAGIGKNIEDVKEKIALPFEPISNDRTVVAYYKGIHDGLAMARDVIDEHMRKEN